MLLKHRNCPPLCAGVLITVISAFGQTTGTLSDGTIWLQLPPVGLAVSETAQVNVVNTGVPPLTAGVGPYCSGSIVFYDIGGSVLGTLRTFTLEPAQTFSAALPFASANASGPRAVIRASIYIGAFKLPTAAGPMVASCWISSSFETYDSATGVTHAIVTGSTALNPPTPEARNTKASRAYEDSQLFNASKRLHDPPHPLLGFSRALDTYGGTDNRPFMGKTDHDYSGQHWTLERVDSN